MLRTLIQNADWLITMDDQRRRLQGCDLLIEDNRIAALGRRLCPSGTVDRVIDATGKLVMPGMVNTHHHCAHTLIRNLHALSDLALTPLLEIVYDALLFLDEEGLYAAALGGLGDLLKTGCTTSNDHHYAYAGAATLDAEIRAAQDLGIRFHPMRGSVSVGRAGGCAHVPDALVETPAQVAHDVERLVARYHDPKPFSLCRVGIAPCWLPYETQAMLEMTRELMERLDISCHSHLADSREEFAFCAERYGCTPTQFAEKMGLLGSHCYYAHCVQLTRADMALLAKTGTGVAHCPNSDMLLNSSVCRLPDLFGRGAHIGIGVDGATNNNASNMMMELKNTYLIHRSTWKSKGLSPEEILAVATVGGAQVLGRDDIGVLRPGMAADIAILDWSQFQYAGGRNDPVAAIVLSGDARMVDTVLVGGRVVVERGRLTRVDEPAAARRIDEAARQLLQRTAQLHPQLL